METVTECEREAYRIPRRRQPYKPLVTLLCQPVNSARGVFICVSDNTDSGVEKLQHHIDDVLFQFKGRPKPLVQSNHYSMGKLAALRQHNCVIRANRKQALEEAALSVLSSRGGVAMNAVVWICLVLVLCTAELMRRAQWCTWRY